MKKSKINKILVANRGEIAIRVFRAATELGLKTASIFAYEDRFSLHRYKADESYLLHKKGSPVASYLDIERIIDIAKASDSDAIHPGYGFLSEREDFLEACNKASINFIGPSAETLDIAGNKVKTRALAKKLKIPLISGSKAIKSIKEAKEFAKKESFPLIFKASYGGGGRGMRVVNDLSELESAHKAAKSEAKTAFGKDEVFLEKYLDRPKHIEVQLLGDGSGKSIHLFERDCSIQRRHQKIIEIAPAFSLKKGTREKLYDYALRLANSLQLKSAATAEFLLDKDQNPYFIEINPRIQVEHTVTEELTGVDIVQSQIKIASGLSLKDLNLSQDNISQRGLAIQCRVTTEDPSENFQPNYGKLVTYRSASGHGIRLDAGSAFTGSEILPFWDSLLVKITASGKDLEQTSNRLLRALAEFRIRGPKTNIPFISNILKNPNFLSGDFHTKFIEDNPELFELPQRLNRANRLLQFIAETTVNGHKLMPGISRDGISDTEIQKINEVQENFSISNTKVLPKTGWRTILLEKGKKSFLEKIKKSKELLITDTTFRDAHQSLLATRFRTRDLLNISDSVAKNASELFSLEMWGGATFDVSFRFLKEDPWERLELLREKIPHIPFQMLLRGSNAVGYTHYPKNVITEFTKLAHEKGIDIFRIFDCLNLLSNMQLSIDTVKEAGGIAEVCICYTGDLLEEEKDKKNGKFNLDYYKKLSEQIQASGADILAIKDMAGLLKPGSAKLLIKELSKIIDIPIHLHSHDTAGGQIATYLAASDSGASIVDCAFSSMSGVTSQPSLEALISMLENQPRQSSLKLPNLKEISSYWNTIRPIYKSFESDLKTSTAEVYINEIPGGQYSNLKPQAESLGLGDRVEEIKQAYYEVDKMLGRIIKVTPSSKVVGDLALFMVSNNISSSELIEKAPSLDLPQSVISFFNGELGEPYGGFPKELKKAVLKNKNLKAKKKALPAADFKAANKEVGTFSDFSTKDTDTISYLLYPKVFKDYKDSFNSFGNLSILPSLNFFYGMKEGEEISVELEPGKLLYIKLLTITDTDEDGEKTVYFELNGQARAIKVFDNKSNIKKEVNIKADLNNPLEISAPLSGIIINIKVKKGAQVKAGDELFTLEAMKMQSLVRANVKGKVGEILLKEGQQVSGGDLVLKLSS